MKFQATTGDLKYTFVATDLTDARHWVINHLDTGNDMDWSITEIDKEMLGHKNTSSSAGSPKRYLVKPSDVVRANVWRDSNGNPSYGMHMKDGTTYLLIDDFGAMNDLDHIERIEVKRKKDLV